MADNSGKENIADGLVAGPSFAKAPSLSPVKTSRRTRSKSIGPGGLGALEEPALKESSGNRRKSAFIPAVKSILASNDEDEKKRREARRKSLARRRVSFAPEATLHTWDVVEYLRDATTSSASSEASRRASSVSQASSRTSPAPESDAEEPPSTPPEQVEEPKPADSSSPANQRDLHQKKRRRRSSGIPPMNFNNPDDVYSSSPLSGDNSSPIAVDHADSDDGDDATTKVDSSLESNESSESNAKLDAALRQAAAHAGTQRFNLDDADDAPMEIAEDEITASFKPWASRSHQPAFYDQENIDPFSPAARNGPMPDEEDGGDDMSMDITRAIGRIVPHAPSQSPGQDDISMDLTMPLGTIKPADSKEPATRRKSLKRRASILEASKGSPAKRPTSRRTSLRNRASPDDSMMDDETMDLTVAIGAIKSTALSKARPDSEDQNDVDMSFGDETMEFTVAVGGIKGVQDAKSPGQNSDSGDDEDMSMEFTNVIGGIKNLNKLAAALDKSASPVDETAISTPTKPKSPARKTRRSIGAGSVSFQPAQIQAQTTPQRSPFRSQKTLSATPTIPPPSQQIEAFEPSPFIRRTPQSASKGTEVISTPNKKARQLTSNDIPDDPLAAPILQRRRSSLSMVQFSPLATAREEPTLKSTAVLSSNLKLLSTPRKQTLTSPMKRGLTPKKSQTPQKATTPKQNTPTPKKSTPRRGLSPKKRVAFGSEPEVQDQQDDVTEEPSEAVERISLQDFLDMTRIRFMELSTTKRRHTAAPAAFHDNEIDETDESFDRYVVAAACTLPEFELYQHACHEMKKYISEGRSFVRDLEANVMEENPLLFSEYLTAPPDQRAIMDNQFKNLKTSARLEAREKWYEWRSTLLRDLKGALLGTMEGFVQDEAVLSRQEQTLDAVLPSLGEKHTELEGVCKQLQQRHDELNSCDREELEQTREQLVATDAEIAEKRQLVAQLQEEIAEKAARIEAATDRKIECAEEIKAAERIREECRGWSTTEVNELNVKVKSLERAHGWSITSASSTTITMTHLNDLELYFQPSAFATNKNTPNASISLAYVGDSATPHPRPLTTSKRFFLQLIRAHLHCIPQSQTSISELLAIVKNGWETALAVAEGVRWLEHNSITDEFILSDERMAISANLLLPSLQTKIRCTFEIGVSLSANGVEAQVEPKAELVYGEKYKVEKMGAFLRDFCGEKVRKESEMAVWADAVLDLGMRLKATGRKGERA